MNNLLLLLILFCSNCCWSHASIVQFQANPTSIDSLFTKTLSLRCSVQKYKPHSATTNRLMRYLQWSTTTESATKELKFFESTTTHFHHATSTTHPPRENPTTTLPTTTTSHIPTASPSTEEETSAWPIFNIGVKNETTTASYTTQISTRQAETSTLPTTNIGVQNEAELSHVTAIVISKFNPLTNGIDTIADVTPFEAVRVSSTFMLSVSAQGNSLSSPVIGEMGYLEVTWQSLNQDQSGEYMCEVFGLDPHNHPVTTKSNLTLTSHEPTMQNLAKYISGLEKRIDEFKAPKIQKGSETCYPNQYSAYVRVSFAESFNTVPMVFTSFSDVRFIGNVNGEFKVQVMDVYTSYFNYQYRATNTSFIFTWLAIEN